MADLESCYFCGRVEDLGEYATPPDRLLPAGHEPQSALLCPDCRTKLRGVLEPIAARIEELESASATGEQAVDSSDQPAPRTTEPEQNGAPTDGEDTGTERADAAGADADATSDDEPARASVDDLAAEAAAGAGGDTPAEYRRVLRLLRNRELPMERSAVVALATGAYDIDDDQCEAILDAAIERGDLGESGSQITG